MTSEVLIAIVTAVAGIVTTIITNNNKNRKELSNTMKESFEKLNTRLTNHEKEICNLKQAINGSLGESIIRRCKDYIMAGEVSFENYKRLLEDHKTYKNNGGNGYANELLEEVKELKKTQ